MKKKIVLWIMTVLTACALAGCGKATDQLPADDQAAVTPVTSVAPSSAGNTDPVTPVTPLYYFDESLISDEYLVGMDYFTGDFLEGAPTVIVKVRYDGRIEVGFDHTLSNGEEYTDVRFFDLTEEQYANIEEEIDLRKLFFLDPEEADPEATMDGGFSYLIIYDENGDVYKACGGFCPHNSDFSHMSMVISENLPEEFFEYCEQYKKAWQREENFDPYPLSGDPSYIDRYATKYGVFLDYDGNLSELDDYNYIVIDAQYHSRDEIVDFAYGYQKYVYSYINIGSVEDFRDYYDEYSDLALGDYENWDGEEWVDVSDERWQNFILNELAPELLEKGINGFFVDNCDVYYNYPTEDILNGLAVIMRGLKDMGCDVIINGGDAFLDAYCDSMGSWTDVITGINQESVFSYIDWDTGALTYASDEDREYFLDYIERYGDQGAYIFLLEYVDDVDEHRTLRSSIKNYCEEHDYLYYISDSIDLN
ncbi:MAG: endo alpha-1,4 polygalactosaminidase [Lachnospiraceae bacterium]|nr:endo alpha-1,4 polygalactosaminidase [Lachnospiraceae bacterium]MBP5252366.1 endo alpha-1,4 polygalactosaminidase [Lachnospiraceae bacterium]MBP5471886.1 endo alpha-1,4 polygalactosaminidase [Lachnospiraceae bacterium]MBP5763462.1 endo alpha-1,4 polygalactosaminidase [Lachnospiraceae bacterium]